ncbi:hypothetical protein [Phocaeicola coprocola]|uniref:hypothetical protein n=1 Tax=Phocaeicola coprocola TaxID=310298 RepID=UPI003FD8982A
MNDKDQFVFLLGGADLEMHTIRQLLEKNGFRYYDKHLRWDNACLSAYQSEIGSYADTDSPQWVGIELQEDMTLPARYISIDHHNGNAYKPSSLEQLAELLEIPLSRQEQLIAANDKAYIPGMKVLQASDAEITRIRLADRACQGVTEEEEKLAELAIREHIQIYDGLIVVRVLCHRFSPICDRLFPYERLLIYTDEEWMYYGKQADRLVESFQSDIQSGKIFYGGGPDGYIGCKRKVYTSSEILQHIELIKDLINHGNI